MECTEHQENAQKGTDCMDVVVLATCYHGSQAQPYLFESRWEIQVKNDHVLYINLSTWQKPSFYEIPEKK